jgi:hypothetical protein
VYRQVIRAEERQFKRIQKGGTWPVWVILFEGQQQIAFGNDNRKDNSKGKGNSKSKSKR